MTLAQIDRERLALRIERLQNQSLYNWDHGDATTFRSMLPNSRILDPRRKLPTPEQVRAEDFSPQAYRDAIQKCNRMEGFIRDNRKGSVKRVMRDIQRGRLPGYRR